MDQAIIKSLLSSEFYNEHKDKIKRSLFEDETAVLFDIITKAHEDYEHDITAKELKILFDINNPIATNSEKSIVHDLIHSVENADTISVSVAKDAINKLWQRETGREITDLGINLMEGNLQSFDRLKDLIERSEGGFMPDDLPEPCTLSLDELLALTTDENRYKFNIPSLSQHVYGIGPTEFMVVFAMSNAGKSAFGVSLACAPEGFCEQGAKVLYVGNEEQIARTRLRCINACSGLSSNTIAKVEGANRKAVEEFRKIEDRITFIDTQDWDLSMIEAYIKKVGADVVIIDQADKVNIGGAYNASHERLRELYRRLREVAKRHECALIAVSQASAEGEGRTRLSYTMMEGSKIGKAAESDLIIGIGKHSGDNDDNEPDNTRFLTVSKNKLSGWHGVVVCQIEPEVSRYVA